MKILVLAFLVAIGYAVLKVIAFLKRQNIEWAAGRPSIWDRANGLGDLIRRLLGK